MQSKNENLVNPIQKHDDIEGYRIYFEIRLDENEFGVDREKHNAICNQQLLAHLEKLSAEGIALSETVSNSELMDEIKNNPQESPLDLTWHHCHSSTVGGICGVMHLVSRKQHEDKALGHIFHPGKKGGLYEWAVPKGAPVDLPHGYPTNVSSEN